MSKKITKTQLAILQARARTHSTELENLRKELRSEVEIEDVGDVASELIEGTKCICSSCRWAQIGKTLIHAIKQAQEHGYGICESWQTD